MKSLIINIYSCQLPQDRLLNKVFTSTTSGTHIMFLEDNFLVRHHFIFFNSPYIAYESLNVL